MGEALRKPDEKPLEDRADPVGQTMPELEVDSPLSAVPSPAKVLQDRLDKHFSARKINFSAQFITWAIIGVCAASWLGGIGLYSTL